MDEIDKEEANICLLDGCSLPAENGKRYCTKRHYHAAQHKCNNPKKAEAALATWMVLTAAAAVPGADDVRFTEERVVIPYIQIIVIIVLIMVAMVASFLAGITYVRHRDLRGDPGLVRDLQEPLVMEEENMTQPFELDNSFVESSVTSILNRVERSHHSPPMDWVTQRPMRVTSSPLPTHQDCQMESGWRAAMEVWCHG